MVERRSVAADVAGSNPVGHPSKQHLLIAGVFCYYQTMNKHESGFKSGVFNFTDFTLNMALL